MKPYNYLAALAIVGLYAIAARLDGPSDGQALMDEARNLEAIQQDEAAQASRDYAAAKVCGNAGYTWTDDKTLVCHLRKPLQFAKVKQ